MEKTPAQARALKNEVETWLNRNGLAQDTGWRSADEMYGEKHKNFPFPHYWVLWFEGELYNVLWGQPPDEPDGRDFARLQEEFRQILASHGCRYEFIDDTSIRIFGREERETTS
jgi:hypothetical protein